MAHLTTAAMNVIGAKMGHWRAFKRQQYAGQMNVYIVHRITQKLWRMRRCRVADKAEELARGYSGSRADDPDLSKRAVEGMSAEQWFAEKIFNETNITGSYAEWIPTITAILLEYSARLREGNSTLQMQIGACNREIAKLREELARTERFLEAERNNHGVSILEWEQVEAENVRLREERDALATKVAKLCEEFEVQQTERLKAESALAEARDKALDEVLEYIATVTGPTGGWLVSPKKVEDCVLALKEKR